MAINYIERGSGQERLRSEQPLLIRNFDAIRKEPKGIPLGNPETFPRLFSSPADFQKHFDEATDAWNYVFDPDFVDSHLAEKPNDASLRYLKTVRRFGLILKSSYRFFDESHLCPEGIYKFVYALGEQNDFYWHKRHEEIVRLIRKSGDIEAADIDPVLTAVSVADFRDFTKKLRDKIVDNQTLCSCEGSAYEFHGLRKDIRMLMNLFQVPAARSPESREHRLFWELSAISTSLGDQHDILVAKSRDDQSKYEHARVEIDDETKERILTLLPYIKRGAGLDIK